MRIFHHHLTSNASLKSAKLSIPRPPKCLGLQRCFQLANLHPVLLIYGSRQRKAQQIRSKEFQYINILYIGIDVRTEFTRVSFLFSKRSLVFHVDRPSAYLRVGGDIIPPSFLAGPHKVPSTYPFRFPPPPSSAFLAGPHKVPSTYPPEFKAYENIALSTSTISTKRISERGSPCLKPFWYLIYPFEVLLMRIEAL